MKSAQLKSSLLLLLTSVIWGFAFVAQSAGMEHVAPFTFTCARSIIGGLVLIPCIFFLKKLNLSNSETTASKKLFDKTLLIGGLCCGTALFSASSLQQIGIQYTTTGKAGFITAFYIILVPIFSIFLRKKVSPMIWIAVVLALTGLYLLCINEKFSINTGDIYVFACAFLFTIQILLVDYFAPKTDGVMLSMLQFFVCGILAGIVMLLFEEPSLTGIWDARISILYAGILSNGVAYTLQIIGQKDLNPAIASLIMSLESCVAVLGGWLILNETLSAREFIGCGIMFAAIIITILFGHTKEQPADIK